MNSTIQIERIYDIVGCGSKEPKTLTIRDDSCDIPTFIFKMFKGTSVISSSPEIIETRFNENIPILMKNLANTRTYSFRANDWDPPRMPILFTSFDSSRITNNDSSVQVRREIKLKRCNPLAPIFTRTLTVRTPITNSAVVYYDLTNVDANPTTILDISGNNRHMNKYESSGTHEVTSGYGIRMTNAKSGFIARNIGNKAIISTGTTVNVGWTTSMWLNVNQSYFTNSSYCFIAGFATDPTVNRAFSIRTQIDQGRVLCSIMGNDSVHTHNFLATPNNVFTPDTWFHLVVSIEKEPNGKTYWRHYWNGIKTLHINRLASDSSIKPFNIPYNSPYSLGYDYGEKNKYGTTINGLRNTEIIIGSSGVFDRVLTDYEALELYNHQKHIYRRGLA
jgi:hypothetical protein